MLASVGLQADLVFTPRYNIASTQEASILALGEDGKRSITSALVCKLSQCNAAYLSQFTRIHAEVFSAFTAGTLNPKI